MADLLPPSLSHYHGTSTHGNMTSVVIVSSLTSSFHPERTKKITKPYLLNTYTYTYTQRNRQADTYTVLLPIIWGALFVNSFVLSIVQQLDDKCVDNFFFEVLENRSVTCIQRMSNHLNLFLTQSDSGICAALSWF